MTTSRKLYPMIVAGLGFCSLTISHAAPLLLDFGPDNPTGANLTNSPYHSVSGNSTFQTWNVLGTADSAGLNFGDGSAATGVSVDLGVSANNNVINFGNSPSSSNSLGNNYNSGVFAGDSVGKDGIFSGSSGQHNVIGLKIKGLAPGTYDVYTVGINTNINPFSTPTLPPMNIGALATTDVGTLDISSLSFTTVSNDPAFNSAWTPGGNYARFSVTLTASDPVLTLFTVSDNPSAGRGFLNTVQVQVIPEPGSLLLLTVALTGLLIFRRRAAGASRIG